MFGKSNQEKWLDEFDEALRTEHYRYKQNIGDFTRFVNTSTMMRLLLAAVPGIDKAIDQMYLDCEKGVPVEEAVQHILDIVKRH